MIAVAFCVAGRMLGCRPHEGFLNWRREGYDSLQPKRNEYPE